MLCLVRSLALGLPLLGSIAHAQDSRPADKADKSEVGKPAPVNARINVKQAAVRCFATAKSPVYLDTLEEGDVVKVGPATGGFRPVVLPLGPTGFVSKRYSTEPAEGIIKSKGSDVSFRYRVPKGPEVPVQQLPKDAPLHVLADDGEWWKVRSPESPAFLDEKDITLLGGDAAAADAALKKTAERRQGEWTAALAAYAKVQADAKAALERRTKVDELQSRFLAEKAKPAEAQSYSALLGDVAALEPTLPPAGDEHARLAILKGEITRQVAVADVLAHKGEQPVRQSPSEDSRPPAVDPLGQRATAIGWLRQRRGAGPGFEIEKGGVVLYLVACSSGRYDLANFAGNEVAITGSTDRPSRDSVRVLDSQKIEVLEARAR